MADDSSNHSELERLRGYIRVLEKQSKDATNAKNDAVARYNEIQSKEASFKNKERLMAQENNRLETHFHNITQRYARYRLDWERKLNQLTDELNTANRTIVDLQKTNQTLTNRAEELSAEHQVSSDLSIKVIESYKNQLSAKSELADAYKNEIDDTKKQVNKLTNTVSELRKTLNEAIKGNGELKTKIKEEALQHTEAIKEKGIIIEGLQNKLENTKKLLKIDREERLEQAIGQSPAIGALKIVKSSSTSTEVYTLYEKAAEASRTENVKSSHLRFEFEEIPGQSLEEDITKRHISYDELVSENTQVDNIKSGSMEHEICRVKPTQADLTHRLCVLLKRMKQQHGDLTSENSDRTTLADKSVGFIVKIPSNFDQSIHGAKISERHHAVCINLQIILILCFYSLFSLLK